MRVLQVHNRYLDPGGEDRVAASEAELLTRAGHEVVRHEVQNPDGGMAAARSLLLAPWNPRTARIVAELAGRVRPDVAHVHNTWYALTPSILAALSSTGVPVVVTLHNYRLICVNGQLFRDGRICEECVGSHPWHGVVHRCYRKSATASAAGAAALSVNRLLGTWERHVRMFFALSHFASARFVEAGLPEERIRVKPNFVGDRGPRPMPPSQSKSVLFVGRLAPEKGLDILLEGWRRLGPTSLELVVIGNGPLRAELERRAPPGVRFIGEVPNPEVREWMLSARALCFPSLWYEGQPVTVLESLSSALPVLASRLGATAELLAELGHELLIPPGDADAWANALRRLQDDHHIDRAAVRSRKLYDERFNEETALALLEGGYADAINQVGV